MAMAMSAIDPRLDELMKRLLAPVRPRVDECIAIVEGCTSGDEAWDRLCARGVIDDAFAMAQHRTFAAPIRVGPPDSHPVSRCSDPECEQCSLSVWLRATHRAPQTTLAAASVASDPTAITTAESLARECAARLGIAQPRSFHWVVADPSALLRTTPSLSTFSSSAALPWEHWSDEVPDPYKLSYAELGAYEGALDDWLLAVTVGLYSTSARRTPLAPFAELFCSGYSLRGFDGDVAILGAPLAARRATITRELPEDAAALRRVLLGSINTTWVVVRAFEVEPRVDDGILEAQATALARNTGADVRWRRDEPRAWCAQLFNRLRWIDRSRDADRILAAVEKFADGPFATLQTDNNRAISRALVGYEIAWSDTAALVFDHKIFTVTTWFED